MLDVARLEVLLATEKVARFEALLEQASAGTLNLVPGGSGGSGGAGGKKRKGVKREKKFDKDGNEIIKGLSGYTLFMKETCRKGDSEADTVDLVGAGELWKKVTAAEKVTWSEKANVFNKANGRALTNQPKPLGKKAAAAMATASAAGVAASADPSDQDSDSNDDGSNDDEAAAAAASAAKKRKKDKKKDKKDKKKKRRESVEE